MKVLLGLVGLLGFGVLLELAPRLGMVPAEYVPPTSEIISTLGGLFGHEDFWVAVRETLRTWMLGLAIAVALGVVVGVLIGSVQVLRAATASTIEFLRPIPSVALIPLVVVLEGPTDTATLILVVYASFWQVLIQTLAGVADIDPVASDTARSYHFGRWARIRYLIWPTALPYVVTGVRLATTVALILTITGELIIGSPASSPAAGPTGVTDELSSTLGQQIGLARSSGAVPEMYALVVVTGLLGVAANVLTRTAERRVLAWHPSVRLEAQVPA